MKIPREFYTIDITKPSFPCAIAQFTKEKLNSQRDRFEGFLESFRTGFSIVKSLFNNFTKNFRLVYLQPV